MIYRASNTYVRFDSEIESRLDFLHNHPYLDVLNQLSTLSPFEVGMLGDFLADKGGITSGTTPRGVTYNSEGVIFLGATNVQHGQLDLAVLTRIPVSYHEGALASSQLKTGDVLISMAGHYIGKCCVFDIDEEANINQALARVRVDLARVEPRFLAKYLNSRWGQLGFLKYRHDVGQPNINLAEIQLLPIIVPTPEQQTKMLNTIAPLEAEAQRLSGQATKVRQIALSTVLSALGLKIEQLQTSPFFFKNTEFNKKGVAPPLPKESEMFARFSWELDDRLDFVHYHPALDILGQLHLATPFKVKTLGEILELPNGITSGSTPSGMESDSNGIAFLGATNISDGEIQTSNAPRIPVSYHEGALASSQLKTGDVLISMAGTVGKCCIYTSDEEANINQALARVRVDTNCILPEFLVTYLNSMLGQLGFLKYRHDVGQPNINLKEIQQLKIIVPPLSHQQRVLQDTNPLKAEALALEDRASRKWAEAKQLFEDMLLGKVVA